MQQLCAVGGEVLLAAHGLTKSFGDQRALDRVDLALRAGEVHGLIGENGSGKSTLIKLLAGYHTPDEGRLVVRGAPVAFPLGPGEFRRFGLDFVHQDLGLIPDLTVAENLWIGALAAAGGTARPLSRRLLEKRAARVLDRFGVALDATTPVATLAPVERALLAIVRAVHGARLEAVDDPGPRILVLDEPTVFLPRADVERVFALVHDVVAQGAAVLFVSHDLGEVLELCTTVTVLRDGVVAGRRARAATSAGELVELMVGRRVEAATRAPAPSARAGTPLLRVRALTGRRVRAVALDLDPGEILGVTGLLGSGYEELPYLLYGATRARSGELEVGGAFVKLAALTPRRALGLGLTLVPGDRRHQGIVGSLSVTDNLTLPRLKSFVARGVLGRARMVADAGALAEQFDVRPRDPAIAHGMLSGGNQQKAVLAKWLTLAPRVLLLDEPTQGVDVGAREQIFGTLEAFAATGAAVVCASSDNEQLARLCGRVLVFSRGTLSAQLTGTEVTKDRITEACYQLGLSANSGGER